MTSKEKREAIFKHKNKYYEISESEKKHCEGCIYKKKVLIQDCPKPFENTNFYEIMRPNIGIICWFLMNKKEIKISEVEILEIKILKKRKIIEVDLDEI